MIAGCASDPLAEFLNFRANCSSLSFSGDRHRHSKDSYRDCQQGVAHDCLPTFKSFSCLYPSARVYFLLHPFHQPLVRGTSDYAIKLRAVIID